MWLLCDNREEITIRKNVVILKNAKHEEIADRKKRQG